MIALEQTVAVLLCAGLSQRFGPSNKLLAPFAGKSLVAHAARLCTQLPFAARLAVVPRDEPELAALLEGLGFALVINPQPHEGKDSSLRLGLARALEHRARGALVLLGDMPHVEAAHLHALAEAACDDRAAISRAGKVILPPTLIPAVLARQALAQPEQPVRRSLGAPVEVAAPAATLADYDRPEDFSRRAGPA